MFEYNLVSKASITTAERSALIPLARRLIGLADRARREGILCLEDQVYPNDSAFLKKLIGMLIDGRSEDHIIAVGKTSVYSSGKEGRPLLEDMFYLETILAISRGDNPALLLERLDSYSCAGASLGIDLDQIYEATRKTIDGEISGRSSLEAKQDHADLPEKAAVDKASLEKKLRAGIALSSDEISFLEAELEKILAWFDGQPELLATVAMYLPFKERLDLLGPLPTETQAHVLVQIYSLPENPTTTRIAMLTGILSRLKKRAQPLLPRNGGPNEAARLLSRLVDRDEILKILTLGDEHMAKKLSEIHVSFETLLRLPPEDVNMVLRNFSSEDVALALAGSEDKLDRYLNICLHPAVYSRICQAAASLEHGLPDAVSRTETAKERIGDEIANLERRGDVVIAPFDYYDVYTRPLIQ